MKVLQLGPYPPPHGGVQTNLVAIRSFLRQRNVPCAVINITRHRKPEEDEVYYPKNAIQLLWLLFRLDYDIIHLHLGGMLSTRLLALGLVCSVMPGRKTVLTFHSGGYPTSPQGSSARPFSLVGFVFRRFDRLIGVNPAIMDFFQRLGVRRDRTRLIYPHSFAHNEISGRLPEGLSDFIGAHSPALISVGLLEPEYDLPLQIQVLGVVRETYPNAGLLMIGSGSLESELRDQIAAQPYASHILLGGDVPHSLTLEAISRCTLMLRTTHYDGDAVSVREALHLNTPVIATDNGMRPEGVHLIPAKNLQALTRAINDVLKNGAQKTSAVAPSDDSNIEAVFDLYQELAD